MHSVEAPLFRGESLYIPFVGAIIEREIEGRIEVLIQTRQKDSDLIHAGLLEIPGGKMQAFEDIYETLRREVNEECGLDISLIKREKDRKDFPNQGDVSTLIQPFCVTQMKNGPYIGMIFICQALGEPLKETKESRNARWIDSEALKEIVLKTPEKIYTPSLGPLRKYLHIMD